MNKCLSAGIYRQFSKVESITKLLTFLAENLCSFNMNKFL